jgi:predicted Fe-S protein YdhL (DUF1289 family)
MTTAVPSPCIEVCAMDAASGLCTGCLRTIDEIALWSQLDDDDKRLVWAQLGERRGRRQTFQAPVAKAVDA